MIKFLRKHVIRNEITLTNHELLICIAIMILPLYGMFIIMMQQNAEQRKLNDIKNTIDRCRIKQTMYNDDLTKSYLCESIKTNKTYFIHESDSTSIQKNGYINRPVKIYKNGTVK